MLLTKSLLLGLAASTSASHQSFACNGSPLYDTGCITLTPAGLAAGMLVYGAANTTESGMKEEGTLACIVAKTGALTQAPFPPGIEFVAARPLMACKDVDIALSGSGAPLWSDEMGKSKTYGKVTVDATTRIPDQHPGQSLGDACRSVAAATIAFTAGKKGFSGSGSTGMPFVAPCPRLGGYMGRGGTAAGFNSFLAKSAAARPGTCSGWCNAWTCSMHDHCSSCATCLEAHAGTQCMGWCNRWTAFMDTCQGCPVSAEACYPFCNAYTCGHGVCTGCSSCTELTEGKYCAMWCNAWTASMHHCKGC